MGVEKQSLCQGAGRRDQQRFDVPAIQHAAPALPELHRGRELVQRAVAIEVGAAIQKYPIFRIKIPDGIASPVVVNENSAWLVVGAEEGDRFLWVLLRFAGILVVGQT